MKNENQIKLFSDHKIRTKWDDEKEEWYFSIVDIIAVLSDSPHPRTYWSKLKTKLKNEGSELYQNWVQLKMPATDGKMRLTDVGDTKQILRLVQSIPSPKAEPFKIILFLSVIFILILLVVSLIYCIMNIGSVS
ncbi:hypothetical protein MBCUT_04770 [Methanobrevibacter cuticularis]|uniref:Bro-N domain-containing protein n=1 Tax=Methanobrevibacter cuticularis TaxID=47311 RepID=A0A166CU71_9EURY|nr:BRO family protein [Methanobrevibacter cuticularis]KZX16847.1 hypothetical protein MBCUT_04770 [Methanobrevibacter cuticularis]